jgi:hypothetical protein
MTTTREDREAAADATVGAKLLGRWIEQGGECTVGAPESIDIEPIAEAIAKARSEGAAAALERVRGLVERWRDAKIDNGLSPAWGIQLRECADHLERALRGEP